MKKIIAVSLLVVLLMGSIMPVAAGTGFNFLNLTLNQNTYRPGDVFAFTGQLSKGSGAAAYAVVTYTVGGANGEKILAGQSVTDELGRFTISGTNRLPETLLTGTYTLKVASNNASLTESFSLIANETLVDLSKDRLRVGEVLDISGTVYSRGLPVPNTDVAFVLYKDGQVASEIYQVRTDSNGRFTAEYRTVEEGNFSLSITVLGQEIVRGFTVERRNNPAPPPSNPGQVTDPGQITNPGQAPTNPPIVVPGLPTQGGANTVVLEDEATPLGGAVSNVTQNESGNAIVEVTVDEADFMEALESEDTTIQLLVKEDLPAEVTLRLPTNLRKLADEKNKPIQLITDEVTLTMNAHTFSAFEGDELVIKIIKKADFASENLSNVYELIVENSSGEAVALDGALELALRYDESNHNNRRALGVYIFNAETETFEYLGGLSNALVPVIKMSVESTGVFAVMKHQMMFTDLAESHWAFNEVNTMVSRHVFNGVGDSRFDGNRSIKRSEFTAALVRAIGMKPANGEVALTDIGGAWYTEVLTTAAANGIIEASGEFRPNDAITRSEMAALIKAAVSYFETLPEVDQEEVLAQYKDHSEMSDSEAENIAIATALGLFNGIDGRFDTTGEATRAQAATVIFRLLDKLEKM